MKRLLAKIRNKRLKGNISLLVILILLASSVISLLSINQIQRLLTYGNMTFNYFRAFYLAKAGNELGLTEVYNSENGFTHRISSGHAIVTGNLLSGYDGFEPYFDMTITGEFLYLTDDIRKSDQCNSGNKIKLAPGSGIMLSLFYDKNVGNTLSEILSGNHDVDGIPNIEKLSFDGKSGTSELTFAFFTYEHDSEVNDYIMEDIVVYTGTNLSEFLTKTGVNSLISQQGTKKYLTIKNSGSEDVEFCIKKNGSNLIPYSNFLITVFGHYGDMKVGLESIVKNGVPDWAMNVIY